MEDVEHDDGGTEGTPQASSIPFLLYPPPPSSAFTQYCLLLAALILSPGLEELRALESEARGEFPNSELLQRLKNCLMSRGLRIPGLWGWSAAGS